MNQPALEVSDVQAPASSVILSPDTLVLDAGRRPKHQPPSRGPVPRLGSLFVSSPVPNPQSPIPNPQSPLHVNILQYFEREQRQ
jgi:hypothetical protein